MKRRHSLLRSTYLFFAGKAGANSLAASLPAAWFLFVKLFGEELGLVALGKELPWVHAVTSGCFLVSFAYTVAKALGEKKYTKEQEATRRLYESQVTLINGYKDAMFNDLNAKVPNAGREMSDRYCLKLGPKENMDRLLSSFHGFFSGIFGIPATKVGLSIVYRLERQGPWTLARTDKRYTSLSLEDLITNSSSCIHQSLNGIKVFYVDKKSAYHRGRYLKNELHADDLEGSIACYNLSLPGQFEMVLTITTQEVQICDERDGFTPSRIEAIVHGAIASRIQMELLIMKLNNAKRCHEYRPS